MVSDQHLAKAITVRSMIDVYQRSEDLIRIGAYQKGSDPLLDKAIETLPSINGFLKQKPDDFTTLEETIQQLIALPA
jgi:flagellum-specific ATP synthase